MSVTSYLSSNLSDAKYNYDLVVGTTAQAINQTLKMYLYKDAPAPKEIWYGQADAGQPVLPMNPIPGIDPFVIKDQKDVPEELLNSNFAFAIKAGFGLPQGVSPLSVPDILGLRTDKQKVDYNMFFSTFQICTLDWGRKGSYAWNNYEQPSGKPYIFTYQVDMNFDPTDPTDQFSNLPTDVQRQLLNYNTNTMFSVQQLYLNLNNAGLQSMPQIGGVPQNSPVYIVLQQDFINTYWEEMNKEGKFILGYAVHTNSQPTSRSSLQPTSLNFMTVPHYNDDGTISKDRTLYTLNYLMETENRKLVVGAPFSWNWIKSEEVNSYHGAMAVRREVFANFLMNAIAPYLSYIAITPVTRYTQSSAGFKWSAGASLGQTSNQKFTYNAQGISKIADYAFTAVSHHSDKSGLISGHYNLDSSASGSISITGNEITVVVEAGMTIDFSNGDLGTADVNGFVGGYKSTSVFLISVDAAGRINVVDKAGYPQPSNPILPAKLKSGFMSGIDGVDGLTDTLTDNYKGMTAFMANFSNDVESYLNSTGGKWIFPGGQTFLFKDAVFSDNQDFVTHITYADPV